MSWLELAEYFGDDFDRKKASGSDKVAMLAIEAKGRENWLFKTRDRLYYDFARELEGGWVAGLMGMLLDNIPAGAKVLDYACGIGTVGLWLIGHNRNVEFADFAGETLKFLKWRLRWRGDGNPVHTIGKKAMSGFDAVVCFGWLNQIPANEQIAFIEKLSLMGDTIALGFLDVSKPNHNHADPGTIRKWFSSRPEFNVIRWEVRNRIGHLVVFRRTDSVSNGADDQGGDAEEGEQ